MDLFQHVMLNGREDLTPVLASMHEKMACARQEKLENNGTDKQDSQSKTQWFSAFGMLVEVHIRARRNRSSPVCDAGGDYCIYIALRERRLIIMAVVDVLSPAPASFDTSVSHPPPCALPSFTSFQSTSHLATSFLQAKLSMLLRWLQT